MKIPKRLDLKKAELTRSRELSRLVQLFSVDAVVDCDQAQLRSLFPRSAFYEALPDRYNLGKLIDERSPPKYSELSFEVDELYCQEAIAVALDVLAGLIEPEYIFITGPRLLPICLRLADTEWERFFHVQAEQERPVLVAEISSRSALIVDIPVSGQVASNFGLYGTGAFISLLRQLKQRVPHGVLHWAGEILD